MGGRSRLAYEYPDLIDVSGKHDLLQNAVGSVAEGAIESFIKGLFARHSNKYGVIEIRHDYYDGAVMKVCIDDVFLCRWFVETTNNQDKEKAAKNLERIAQMIRKGKTNG